MSREGIGREVVLVGAGLASLSAAETLRRTGFDGSITLLGAEDELPYDRPPLSKDLLLGRVTEEKVFLRPAEFYAEQAITVRPKSQAIALDPLAREITLADGSRVRYDLALLATGSAANLLRVPHADLPGVVSLRTLGDARALAAALASVAAEDAPVVLIGAGFIGAEVAAVCRARGLAVTVVEPLAAPMVRALGAEVGGIFADLHRAHGVDLRLGVGVAELRGATRVEELITTSGERLPCGLAVVAVGAHPLIDWLAGSGLTLRAGVVVDEHCATNVPRVYAAGDIAEWPYAAAGASPVPVRLEHWDNALRQGEAAALNMVGRATPYLPLPYFWTDQYEWRAQMAGLATVWDQVVLRGRPGDGSFTVCYLADGHIRAALAVNRVREFLALKRLIGAGTLVPPEMLADDAFDLRTIAPGPRSAPPQG